MTDRILVIRTPSGLSGDMLLTGLVRIAAVSQEELDRLVAELNIAELVGSARIVAKSVGSIAGWGLEVTLPHSHDHRHLGDIARIIEASDMTAKAKALALSAFTLLAGAEGAVHGIDPDQVHFHEVGALDSILDVCVCCALFDRLSPARFVCSPLPVCDGAVRCAHGLLPSPAPATLALLTGIPIYGIASEGETVTPTAASLLQALGAEFGPWPALVMERQERIYGGRILPGVPNGALFALGLPHSLALGERASGLERP